MEILHCLPVGIRSESPVAAEVEADDGGIGEGPHSDRSDDAPGAASSTTESPEEIGVLVGIGNDMAALDSASVLALVIGLEARGHLHRRQQR